jgi:hypothetical protein
MADQIKWKEALTTSSEDQAEVPARSYSGRMVDEHRRQQDARRRHFEVR